MMDNRCWKLEEEFLAIPIKVNPLEFFKSSIRTPRPRVPKTYLAPRLTRLARLDDLVAACPFGKWQDPRRPGEFCAIDDEEDTYEAATNEDDGSFPVMEGRPEPVSVNVDHQERWL
jgi:hypothetical protein